MSTLPAIFYLMGPTGAGKTPLAVELVERFPFEIISVDSVMIYRGMGIGSAKPDVVTLQKAPHHLIDIVDPANAYSAGQFYDDAQRAIQAILSRGKVPLFVGGTMLYFRVLQQGIAQLPRADATYRSALEAEAAQLGWPAIHARLLAIDPRASARIHPHDSQRIQRALEVYHLTGKTITDWQLEKTQKLTDYSVFSIAIAPREREALHARIAARFAMMLEQGLIAEVETLYNRGDLASTMPSMRAVGYRQVWRYLTGEIDYITMQAEAIAATRQLAKRQLTWLRSWPKLQWFDSTAPRLMSDVAQWIEAMG